VSAWITPALAAVFWAGLLLQPRVGEFADPWVWLSAGGGLLGAALALAPGRVKGPGSLERAGLVEAGPRDLRDAVAPAPIRRERAVWAPLPLAFVGSLLLAIGWGSVHEHRVRDAVLARISGPVTVEGSLRVDPSVERDRWSAVLDARSVRWEDGGAAVRETIWLSGRDEPPDVVRGDRLRISGWVRPVEDQGFASFLLRRGIAAELEVDVAERVGPAAFAPVRWAQSFRALP